MAQSAPVARTGSFIAAASVATIVLKSGNLGGAVTGTRFDNVTVSAPTAPANRAPRAVATANPSSGVAPLAVQFDGTSSTDPDGDPLGYFWDFGDGGQGTGSRASHTYQQPGTYVGTLTVSDGRGGTSDARVTIQANAPSSGGPNLLTNGGFEAGFTNGVAQSWVGWSIAGSGYTYARSFAASGPSASIWIEGAQGPGYDRFRISVDEVKLEKVGFADPGIVWNEEPMEEYIGTVVRGWTPWYQGSGKREWNRAPGESGWAQEVKKSNVQIGIYRENRGFVAGDTYRLSYRAKVTTGTGTPRASVGVRAGSGGDLAGVTWDLAAAVSGGVWTDIVYDFVADHWRTTIYSDRSTGARFAGTILPRLGTSTQHVPSVRFSPSSTKARSTPVMVVVNSTAKLKR